MSGGLTIELDRAHPVWTIRASGTLDAYTAADVGAALLEALAEQPAGVLVEIDGLSVVDDIGLAVFATVAQQNRTWPRVGLVLAGPSQPFRAAADTMGVTPYVPMCPDRPTALAHLTETPVPPWRRDHIQPSRDAPGEARSAVAEFCAELGVAGASGDVMGGEAAQLVASELVTNAVVHAGTPIELTLRLIPPLLHIAVRDGGDGQPRITGLVDESAESGRGLVLVEALSSAWGSFVPPVGKIVWAAVRVRSATVSS